MTVPLQITFRNLKPNAQVENWVQAEAHKLETFYPRIMDCRVAIELPHRHHRKGKPIHLRIDLKLPGREIVVKREPVVFHRTSMNGNGNARKRRVVPGLYRDLHLVIHDGFKAAGRRVQDFARRRRGQVKSHDLPA